MAHLGIKTLREFSELEYVDLIFWMNIYRVDPFGSFREDMRAATISMSSIMPHVDKHANIKFEDFMPKFEEPKPQTQEDIVKTIMTLKRFQSGKA